MSTHPQKKVLDILDAVLALPIGERLAFLEAACAGNEALREEVDACIQAEETSQWRPLTQLRLPPLGRTEVGPYRIIKEIGSGGMGTVYLAERLDREYDHQVAIKVLKRGMDTDHLVLRFRAERQILARLNHQNIAKLFDGGTTEDGLPYLVMEYVEGIAIDRYCIEQKLAIPARLALFRHVCGAVAYAHENLVVHRDIKPSNIFVSRSGSPKLLDFGIAKFLQAAQNEPATQTAPALQMMTFEYSCPEQIRGEPATTSHDVYGLGLLLYELLAGQRPFRFSGTTPQTFMRMICDQDPEKPSLMLARQLKGPQSSRSCLHERLGCQARDVKKWQRELAGDLDNITLRALKKDPGDRYDSVVHLADDLNRYEKNLPVFAQKESSLTLLRKFIQRHRLGVAVSVVFALTCLLFSHHILAQRNSLRVERERVIKERDKSNQIVDFLVTLFSIPEPSIPREQPITAQELLNQGVENLQRGRYAPNTKAHLVTTLGIVYRGIGLFDESKPLLEQGLHINRKLYGDAHAEVVLGLNELGNLFQMKGAYDEAYQMFQQAQEYCEHLPPESPAITQTFLNIAANARRKAEYPRALLYGQKALVRQREFLEPNHPAIAENLSQLGLAHQHQGNFEASLTLFEEAMTIAQKSAGDQGVLINRIILNLASVHQDTGDLLRAEQCYRQGIAWQRQNFGPDHPEITTTLNNFATLLMEVGKYNDAEAHFLESLAISIKVFGEHSPTVTSVLHNLSGLHHLQGNVDKTEQILRRIITIDRENLGEEHPYVASSLGFLGWIMTEKAEYAQAKALYQEALAILSKTLGRNHPDYALQLGNYGMVYQHKGEYAQAEPILRESLALTKNLFEEHHAAIAFAINRLIVLKLAMQAYGEAEALALESLAVQESQPSPSPHLTVRTNTFLAISLTKLGQFQRAEDVLLKNYEHCKSIAADGSVKEILILLPALIDLYSSWEKPVLVGRYQQELDQQKAALEKAL